MAVPLAVSTQYANVTDTQPVRHHMTTKTTLMHNIARQKLAEVDIQSHCESQSFKKHRPYSGITENVWIHEGSVS